MFSMWFDKNIPEDKVHDEKKTRRTLHSQHRGSYSINIF